MAPRKLTPEQEREREQISLNCQKWLKDQMKIKGWGVNRVAEESGVSKQNVSRVYNGTRSKNNAPPIFTRATILELAKAFNSSVSEALAVIKQMPDNVSDGNLKAQKAGDLLAKLPPNKQDEALDYLQHLANNHAAKKAVKKVEGEKATRRTKKKANGQ